MLGRTTGRADGAFGPRPSNSAIAAAHCAVPLRTSCTAVNEGIVSGSTPATATSGWAAAVAALVCAAPPDRHGNFCLSIGTATASPSIAPPQSRQIVKPTTVKVLKTRDRV